MNLDDFKSSWQQRNDQLVGGRLTEMSAEVVARAAKFEAVIRRRDWVETAAAAVVLIFFGVTLITGKLPMIANIGVVIILLSAVEIVAVLFWTRHRDARPNSEASLLDFCSAEIQRVERQIRLLRNVTWWYSGPILLGACVFTYGVLESAHILPGPIYYGFLAAFLACFVAVGVIIHGMNVRAVKRQLIPVRDELAELIRSLSNADAEVDSSREKPG